MCTHARAGDTAPHTYVHTQSALGRAAQLQRLCLHLSHRPIGADVFSKRAGTEPCMAMAHVLQGSLSGLQQPGPIKLTPMCALGTFSELPECFFQMDVTQEEASWCILTLILDTNQSSAGGGDLEALSTASIDPEKVTSTRAVLETSSVPT
ncbi:unnamed protein product [Coccothraustes coccothraustes]